MACGGRGTAGGRRMKRAIVLDANDVKKLIAEKYGVKEECVLKSQYSYTVVLDGMDEEAGDGLK